MTIRGAAALDCATTMQSSDDRLAAIRARPEDDGPRLALAQQLRERGDPRGEFIELQCAVARCDDEDDARGELEARAEALLAAHAEEWHHELGLRPGEATWVRGFVDTVSLTPGRIAAARERLVRGAPVRGLHLRGLADDVEALESTLRDPLLSVITALDLCAEGNDIGPDGAIALAEATHLTQLRELRLRDNRIEEEGGIALAGATHFAGLTKLDLRSCQVGTEGVKALAAATQLANLRELWLGCTFFDSGRTPCRDEGVFALAAASHLNQLVTLDLQWNEVRLAGARALAAAPQFAGLRELWLGASHLGAEGATAVATGLPNLTLLDLYDNDIGPKGVRSIARRLKHLRTLDVSHNHIGIEGVQAIAGAESLAGLRELRLPYNKLDDEGAAALAKADRLTRLKLLDLRDNDIGPSGIKVLLAKKWLSRLETLLLDNNPLGTSASQALAKATHLTRLRALRLTRTGFGPEGAAALASATHLADLRELFVHRNPIRDDGVAALMSGPWPRLRVLILASTGIGDEGVRTLAGAPVLSRLTGLDLSDNQIGDEGLRALAAGRLDALVELWFESNPISVAGVAALAAAPHLRRLLRLHLKNNREHWPEGFRPLIGAPWLGSLHQLDIGARFAFDERSELFLSEFQAVAPDLVVT
ncbi:TIGR02996 domain-containing protein [Nannocystis punicea]|uniref:TIGR02996 domain-containing protein n=1 Tax=Nannocystis punicea TaxID=2995304 RepID=A0ABY7HDM2_9BACT|nr:TIGR02996 domain-containing protein [Nannocystis poenicansa]WAS97391.1 TIGR02996 domain-containing protein [Nannocystis poenicansa]